MAEENTGGGGGGESSSSTFRTSSSFERFRDRIRFTVDLRPGETTIVSWKKLVKDASKGTDKLASSSAASEPSSGSNLARAASAPAVPGKPAADDLKDVPAPHRFSAVIEKIERLYMGKDSSDEEDLDGIPDDDQYDTEDSFIDDAELDEYFEVDKSKTKHDGFFVNRGKLENIEPSASSVQQPKKRRRKEIGNDLVNGDTRRALNKQMKVRKKAAVKMASSVDGGVYGQQKIYTGKLNNAEGIEISSQLKERNGNREQIDLKVAVGQHSMQNVKNSLLHKKEGSLARLKGNQLEKAIRELEKMVADSRPPTSDVQDADASSQAVKRRLPREMKLKLAKVARLATSNGKVTKELLSRLMSILGHLMQLRTLKRHLKILANTSLSTYQEKEDKFRQIKNEMVEMIKLCAPSFASKAIEHQGVGSDDFQEYGSEARGLLKGYYSMDAAMEDKICDLYDIFVDGLDDDAAPQIRKLYAELADLWPKGVMDNHGIKRAICRAKERRKTHDMNKDQEKIKRKKRVVLKAKENPRIESNSGAQPSYAPERLPSDPSVHAATPYDRLSTSVAAPVAADTAAISTSIAATIALGAPNFPQNVLNFDRPKQEKVKGMPSTASLEIRGSGGAPMRKKVKRKAEADPDVSHLHQQKLHSQQVDEKKKSSKMSAIPVSSAPQKPTFQSVTMPRSEQLT